jgi:methylated-DNA-[protein]-cysteine S-methyltransferase
MATFWDRMESPVGWLTVTVNERGAVTSIVIQGDSDSSDPADADHDPVRCATVVGQLQEYFEGTRRHFKLDLDPSGTDFQQLVWDEVSRIPYGGTRSYGHVARRLGKPTAVRAVGTANGANPIPIVIPCHRVVGADGSLVGYGGGLDVKAALLEHEGVRLPTDAQLRFAFE